MDTISCFWDRFKENNQSYLFLDLIEEDLKEDLLNDLLESLHKYCDKLFFEIGGHPDEDRELIITAEGNKDYFDKAEELIHAAPSIEGWIFIALIPPRCEHFKGRWDDLELDTEDIRFLPLSNKKNSDLGIRLLLGNYDSIKDNEVLMPLLYKMLDTIVGERSFALDIHYVDTGSFPDNEEEDELLPIIDLPKYIVWHKLHVSKSSN